AGPRRSTWTTAATPPHSLHRGLTLPRSTSTLGFPLISQNIEALRAKTANEPRPASEKRVYHPNSATGPLLNRDVSRTRASAICLEPGQDQKSTVQRLPPLTGWGSAILDDRPLLRPQRYAKASGILRERR